ncbi:MAG: hypothetical protein ACI841_002486 [Planctomycetota bacterium]|jgi:hypothetical protein
MTLSIIAGALLAGGTAPTPIEVSELRPKAYRTWSIELPADAFHKVAGTIPVPHAGGTGFAVETRGVGLAVDTTGDGTLDRVVEGRVHPETKVREARILLTGKHADGSELRYPVRLESKGKGWQWASGGALIGELNGTAIQVIDMDGNGRHGDVGTDAIVVGGTDVAQFVGESVSIDGDLFALSFDGARARIQPFEGEVGTLDLHTAFDGKGVLLAAVVKSLDGAHSFEMSLHDEGLSVPAGEYRLVSAALGLGKSRVTIIPTEMKSLTVGSDACTELEWGAPIRATFAYQMTGSELVLDPREVKYVGAAGEQWVGWSPIGKSPKFQVKEKDSGEVLVDVVFPGSC